MKRMTKTLLAAAVASAALVSVAGAADDLGAQAAETFKALPSTVPAVKDNPITPDKIALGKTLFFDTRMSRSGVFSCNSCHSLATGGDDNLETSIGHGWLKGPRNAPTVLNAVFNEAQFWDGRAEDLKAQAKGPVQAGVEMANTPDQVLKTLNSMPQYVVWFKSAFPGETDPVSFDNFAKAIEAFEATLITPAPFDAYLNGVNLGGTGYYPFGLVEKPGADVLPEADRGRFSVTKTADDSYVFRAAAQHRAHRALFPFRQGLGPEAGGRDHGRGPVGPETERGGRRQDRRLPAIADRPGA